MKYSLSVLFIVYLMVYWSLGTLVCVGTTMAVDRNIYFYVHTQSRIALHVSYLPVCLFVCPYLSRV